MLVGCVVWEELLYHGMCSLGGGIRQSAVQSTRDSAEGALVAAVGGEETDGAGFLGWEA